VGWLGFSSAKVSPGKSKGNHNVIAIPECDILLEAIHVKNGTRSERWKGATIIFLENYWGIYCNPGSHLSCFASFFGI